MKSPKARAPSAAALGLVMTLLACQLHIPVRPSFTAFSEPTPTSAHSMPGLQQAGFALSENDEATRARASEIYSRMPIAFEANCGQVDSPVKFLSRNAGYTLFLTATEAVMMLSSQESKVRVHKSGVRSQHELGLTSKHRSVTPDHRPPATATLRMKLTGSNPEPVMEGIDPLPGRSNYITGNDPSKWQTNVAQYARVKYADIYSGIDLIYHGDQGGMEYDFVLSPGADPKTINLSFEGAQRMRIDSEGDLVLKADAREIRQPRPVAYQEIEGRRKSVECRFALKDRSEVGFELGEYDANRPLVIDPVLSYSTYLGGSGDDFSFSLDLDASGNAYVAGLTDSSDFPTTAGAFQRGSGGGSDVFVTKVDAKGAVVYSTYLGGSDDDFFFSSLLKVDTSGNVNVVGETDSSDFPTTAGGFQRNSGGSSDVFVTKLDANGEVLYSTYLGGRGDDFAFSLGLDASANVYVFGDTDSFNLPTTAGALQRNFGGRGDSFVTKLDASGKVLYLTYLGGSFFDESFSLGVDASGSVYVFGDTDSRDFPTTAGAFQRNFGGLTDVFVTKLDANGKGLYSTYLGGSSVDFASCLEIDASGNVDVVGETDSSDFPTTAGAFQRNFGGFLDSFVTKLEANGKVLYSTYLGGSADDVSLCLELDALGNVYAIGDTRSSDFPTTEGAFQRDLGGFTDVFVTKLDANGKVLYSTYIGGSGDEESFSVKLDASGNVYVAGSTDSSDFPTRFPIQPVNGGIFFEDAFTTAFDAAGSLIYSTYFGGSGSDVPEQVAVDSSGSFYLAGFTGSPDFPITSGAFQSTKKGEVDGFIAKIERPKESGTLRIFNASVIRKTLYVVGEGFDQEADLLLDGKRQATRLKESDRTVLISKQAGKKIKGGQTVAIRVRNSDGRLSDVFNFTRLR